MVDIVPTQEELDLVRAILADVDVTEPYSFKILDSAGVPIVVEGFNEFFAADQIRAFYSIYAKTFIALNRQRTALELRVNELEERLGKTETFRKSPVRPIRVDEI